VITADDAAGVGGLLRWDPAGYAGRELGLRQELSLPPAVRVASLTGPRTAVGHFTSAVEAGLASRGITLRTAGPAPLPGSGFPASSVPGAGGPGAAVPGTGGPGAQAGGASRGEHVRTLLFIPYAQAAEVTKALRAVKAAAAAKRSDDPVQVRLDGVDVL